MKWRSILLLFVHGVLANTTVSPNCTSTAIAGSTASIPSSAATQMVSATGQDNIYCFDQVFADRSDFQEWARQFCNRKFEPLSQDNDSYKGAYGTSGRFVFSLQWDRSCSGTRTIDPNTCFDFFSKIEQQEKCRTYRGGFKEDHCIVYNYWID